MAKVFTKEDYQNYFTELEEIFSKNVIAYTDMINILNNQSIKSKLLPLATEDMNAYKFIKQEKEKHFQP